MPAKQRPSAEEKIESADPGKFDLRTHFFGSRNTLEAANPYTLHIKDGISYFERPKGSGNLYAEDNSPVGRIEAIIDQKSGKVVGKKFDFEAEHKAFSRKPAQSEAEAKLSASEAQVKALEAEIALIRKEAMDKLEQGPHRVSGTQILPIEETVSKSLKDDPENAVKSAAKQMPDAPAERSHEFGGEPTPANVHAQRLTEDMPALAKAVSGPGSGPTPDNVHAQRVKEEAVSKAEAAKKAKK